MSEMAKEEPEFKRLLNSLERAGDDLIEVTSDCVGYAGNLKPIERDSKLGELIIDSPKGVIDLLWIEVNRIHEQNSELRVLAVHLRSLIG